MLRGPGSSLYGADAFSGVINIITKRPGEGKNGVAGGYGSAGTTHGSLWASGRDGDFAYRLAAGYDYLPRWSREVPNGRADVRTVLSMATVAAVRCNPVIRAFHQRLLAAGKPAKLALTACMRKLLVILNAIARTRQPWQSA